jgi:hypothetical protein
LPPQKQWDSKLEEIMQIRHRVAHFRTGHHDDLARVLQLLRDLDQGFWRFCTSYNDSHPVLPQSDDAVTSHFLQFDPFPWGQFGDDNTWARFGFADPTARLGMTIEVLCRPWAAWAKPAAGHEGLLFDVRISARQQPRYLHYRRLLQRTSGLHSHVVHITLENMAQAIRMTIPDILGADKVIEIIDGFYQESLSALGYPGGHSAQDVPNTWPEYVLGSDNPLAYLSPEMPCSFFGV